MRMPATVETATTSTARQLAPESVPRLQKVIERASGARAMEERNPRALIKRAFSAGPARDGAEAPDVNRSRLRVARDVGEDPDGAHEERVDREPRQQQRHDGRAAVFARAREEEDEVGREHPAEAGGGGGGPEGRAPT